MSYAIYDILNKPFQYRIGVIVALYYLFMSLGNGYSNYTIKISDKRRYLFYQKYKPAFLTIIVVSALIMFYLAYNVDIGILMLTILSTLLGTAYNISFEKNDRFNHSFFFRLFKKLVPFKAIIISIAVTTLLNGSILPAWRGVKSITVFLMALPISYHIELECEA